MRPGPSACTTEPRFPKNPCYHRSGCIFQSFSPQSPPVTGIQPTKAARGRRCRERPALVNRQRVGVCGWLGDAKIHIRIPYVCVALAEPRRCFVSPIVRARNCVSEFSLSGNVEDVVVKARVLAPSVPVGKQQQTHGVLGAYINGVVVNRAVLYRSRDIDTAGSVILTDVVADNGSGISGALCGIVSTLIADQQKTAVVVMAVVILNDCVPAVPIGIEAFSVALAFGAVSLVVLNQRVVRAPRPDPDVVSFRPLVGAPHDVALHHGTDCCHDDDPVSPDVVQKISANSHTQARIPL